MANLSVATEIADRVYIFDNSVDGTPAFLAARTQDGQLRKVYGPLPTWVERAVGLARHLDFVDLRAA